MDDVRTVLHEAEKQLVAIGTLFEADLTLQRASPTLRGKIKGFLANQRAALDHLAEGVVAAHGAAEAHTHYPFARDAEAFDASIDKNMPGVRTQQPDVATVISRHQPFSDPGLAELRDLLTDPTLQKLTPETRERPKPDPAAVPEPPAAGSSEPVPPAPPVNAGGGVLSGGLFINGVSHDPVTLQRQQEAELAQSKEIYVDWRFGESETSALATLAAIDAAVRAAITEVSAAAGLA
jgi:hypothetical protein